MTYLLEHGHADEVRELAGGSDWFCAKEWARWLADRGRPDEALEALAPYVATGWWTAVRRAAELLERWGRADEAVALLRPYAQDGNRSALEHFAVLIAGQGRAEEAYGLLRPHLGDPFLARALVEVAAGLDRDEELAALLADRIASPPPHCPHCDRPDCGGRRAPEPWNAVALLATVRERQGRIDEAVALLRPREITSVNGNDQLAELLLRHGRIAELREYAATESLGDAARRLAEFLEARGDVEGAAEAYRPHVADGSPNAAVRLAELLARHGRGDEGIALLRDLPGSRGNVDDWFVDVLCGLYAGQGRAEEALAYLDDRKARTGTDEWEFFRQRPGLLASCGRTEQAIEEVRAHPEGSAWYAAPDLARLLLGAGRPEEALAVLDPEEPNTREDRAELLMQLGRVGEAVALLQRRRPLQDFKPTEWSAAPPF
ncbi:lipopolysaccharide assembly protein LapB [Streptomyces sp. NBC_00091]|uniref:tetratricopeptide repeat protein n=1 Tax=Streptomyces sp. NBC_00091 TaxID=2975648 RepID=UPI002254D593|nr:hypothetical protein [Streptomyces sp. NBC_00091]MCX5377065.1 hypothetical protein [Streptomyces sp. NBC_00091]